MGLSAHEDLFFFFEITCFWTENALNFGEHLFFGDHLIFDRKTSQSDSKLLII